jgi:phospholipid/cholesterol/gamma-HCH transport system substrate-binding protein
MNRSRVELKVGFFVLFCLVLVGGLLIRFSKGTTFLRPTYEIVLNAANVGGLRRNASVQLSGVPVGTVSQIELAHSGTNVAITLKIYSDYPIKDDARFAIEQAGFLGDQYVAVYPDKNQGNPFTNGEQPFNIQEFTRSAAGFVSRLDETAKKLDDAIADVRRDLLNQKTLTNLAYTIDTLQKVSENAVVVVDNLNLLVTTNAAPVGVVLSNFSTFSERLNTLAASLQQVVDTNQPQVATAVSNLATSTEMLTNFLHQAESGKGLAGALLSNEELASNITTLASNLAVASGNLRTNGLWAFLWKPHTPETNAPRSTTDFPGRNPQK